MGKTRKDSVKLSAVDVVPVTLDEWSVVPASLDDWAMEPGSPEPAPKRKKKSTTEAKEALKSENNTEDKDSSPKKTSKKTAGERKKRTPKAKVLDIDEKAEVDKASQGGAPTVSTDPVVAVSLDDWADPEAIQLDQWTLEDEEPKAEDLFDSAFDGEGLEFENLGDNLEAENHPVLPENHGLETHTPLDDTPLPEDSYRAAEEFFEEALPELTLSTTGSLDLDFDGDSVNLNLEQTSIPARDEFDPEESVAGSSFEVDFDVPLDELDGPVEVSENIFEEHGPAVSITPIQTRTVEVKFLESELMEGLAFRGKNEDTESSLITNDEDLGLDIDDLDLPGSEIETVGLFKAPEEMSFDFDVKDDEGDGFFDLRTVATMIDMAETLEDEKPKGGSQTAEPRLSFDSEGDLDDHYQEIYASDKMKEPQNDSEVEVENFGEHHDLDFHPPELQHELQNEFQKSVSLQPLVLTTQDLAEQQMVVTLTEADLRENNQLAVICLSERDLASQHRIVIELSPNFFVDNDIQQNIHGVILLKSSDLAHPEAIEVAKAPRKEMGARIRKPKAEGKSTAISYIFAIMSSTKANLLAWPFF